MSKCGRKMKIGQFKEQAAGVIGFLEEASSRVVELDVKEVVFSDRSSPVINYTFTPKYPSKKVKVRLTDVE